MNYFEYPLDTKLLIRKKIAIKKQLLNENNAWIEKRVAVLGGSTTNEIVEQLELFLLYYGIKADFYQSEYGLYYEDAVFGNCELEAFTPDIIYIHTNWRNISIFPNSLNSVSEVDEMLASEFGRFKTIWQSIREKYNCTIIQNNFERPNYRLLGNRDIWDYRGRCNYISRLNQKFYEYAEKNDSIYINDIDYIAGDYGYTAWNDSIYWDMYKYICPLNAIPYLSQSIGNIIKSLYGKNKKLLALDLDNTLWGGIIGDDGVEGIRIGQEVPSGQSYYEFQSYVKALQHIGVVLAVDSKNDESNALEGLGHPDGVLHKEDFVSIKANWNPKDQNLQEIANELSLGLDSFVFADDNPAEREIVGKQLPEVAVPVMDAPENYIKMLDHSGYFEVTTLSTEDMKKTEQYRARASVKSAQKAFENYDEYLESLQMRAIITEFESVSVQRVAQLTNKSNQFNLTTLRCSEDDVWAMQNNSNYICLCGRLIDKYTDNGIVSIVAGEIIQGELHIRLWLMSCRVLKRGLEDYMMNVLVSKAKARGIKRIFGYFYPTAKNSMVKDFYKNYGYNLVDTGEQGNCTYLLDIDDYKKCETQILEG